MYSEFIDFIDLVPKYPIVQAGYTLLYQPYKVLIGNLR
eukprot:SAG11_NODE_2783_length_2977_cov_1.840862_3_plen_37_part_01